MQRALDGWLKAQDELLRIPRGPLPWMIFFDPECAWHVAPDPDFSAPLTLSSLVSGGEQIPIAALQHREQLRLPDGRDISVAPLAFTAPYAGPRGAYFVVALPEVWRPLWKESDPPLEEFFLGVAIHELTHTLQISDLARRIKAIAAASPNGLPAHMSDDIIEDTFKSDTKYVALFERERDLAYEAAFEKDRDRAGILALESLAMARERRLRFFSGEKAHYAELEGLFLNLEGLGTWVAYRMAEIDPANFTIETKTVENRGRGTDWVQGHGLALMLLIARFVPDWQEKVLDPSVPSPFDLLETALTNRD